MVPRSIPMAGVLMRASSLLRREEYLPMAGAMMGGVEGEEGCKYYCECKGFVDVLKSLREVVLCVWVGIGMS